MNNMMNSPLPMGGNGAGTLILGDLTIVQNHNFGMGGNPQMQMMQMQQQMALQQQQNNMLLLGMANALVKQNQKIKMLEVGDGYNDGSIEDIKDRKKLFIENDNLYEHMPEEEIKKPFAIESEAQDVEYEIKNVDDDNESVKETSTIGKHMCKFFTNGELKEDIQFNKFYKVDEDVRTFVIFIKKNVHNPAAWRKTFRDAYRSHQTKVIKGPIDDLIIKQDAIYIAVLFSTQGGKPDIIFIDKKMNGRNFQISDEMMKEYIDGVDISFGNIYRLCEPYIPENSVVHGEISNYHDIKHPCCHVRDTLFSNVLYLTDDM